MAKKKTEKKTEVLKLTTQEMMFIEQNNARKKLEKSNKENIGLQERILTLQITLLEKERQLLKIKLGELESNSSVEDSSYEIFFGKLKTRLGLEKFSFNPWTGEVKDESKI